MVGRRVRRVDSSTVAGRVRSIISGAWRAVVMGAGETRKENKGKKKRKGTREIVGSLERRKVGYRED